MLQRFIKYMLHELTDFLSNEETKYYADYLVALLAKVDHSQIDTRDPYFTKFYKFPFIRLNHFFILIHS